MKLLNSRYPINQSPFYKLQSKTKLCEFLVVSKDELASTLKSTSNYSKFTLPAKNDGFSKPRKSRFVEEPCGKLAVIHTRILDLLKRIETPDYLHSAVKKRSYITNARTHVNGLRAIKFDIRDFFPSINLRHIHNFFVQVFQCSSDVANLMAEICTCEGKLPTGSPISPLLSFFVFKQMFDELHGLSASKNVNFSLYIDDMVFSGDHIDRDFAYQVKKIISRFGLSIHDKKTIRYKLGATKVVTGIAIRNGSMKVVHQRFKFIRLLTEELKKTTVLHARLKILERLIGLLGEASQIEPRFRPWVDEYKDELNASRKKLTFIKVPSNSKALLKTRKLKRIRSYLIQKALKRSASLEAAE